MNGCSSHSYLLAVDEDRASQWASTSSECASPQPSSGQMRVWVPNCQGTGCMADGKNTDCAWCVYDMSKCVSVYHSACYETNSARAEQGMNGCSSSYSSLLAVDEHR